jgi:hypothetical protein
MKTTWSVQGFRSGGHGKSWEICYASRLRGNREGILKQELKQKARDFGGEKLRTCLKDTEGCLSKQGEQYDQSAIIKNDIDQNGQKITVESVQNMERKKQKSGVDGFCFPLQTHPFQFSLWTTTLRGSFSGKKQRQSEGRTRVRSQGLSAWVPCCRCLHTGHPSVGSLSSNCHEKRKRK